MTSSKHIVLAISALVAMSALLMVASAGTAIGGDAAHPAIDISKVTKKLSVLHDGDGHYIVVGDWANKQHMYWGDGDAFYLLRWTAGANNKKTDVAHYDFWSPRDSRARLTRAGRDWKLECSKRTTEFTALVGDKADEASKVLATATFSSSYWQRRPYALLRDARGVYYYVDRLRDEYDGADFRLFTGKPGNLKRRKLVNIDGDPDSAGTGDVFSAKKGELRINGDDNGPSTWVRGDEVTTLEDVDAGPTFVYRELGVYKGEFGVPCDTL